MNEVWTRTAKDGKTIVLKKEGDKEIGFVYLAEGRTITETQPMQDDLTRDQVEQLFASYLTGE